MDQKEKEAKQQQSKKPLSIGEAGNIRIPAKDLRKNTKSRNKHKKPPCAQKEPSETTNERHGEKEFPVSPLDGKKPQAEQKVDVPSSRPRPASALVVEDDNHDPLKKDGTFCSPATKKVEITNNLIPSDDSSLSLPGPQALQELQRQERHRPPPPQPGAIRMRGNNYQASGTNNTSSNPSLLSDISPLNSSRSFKPHLVSAELVNDDEVERLRQELALERQQRQAQNNNQMIRVEAQKVELQHGEKEGESSRQPRWKLWIAVLIGVAVIVAVAVTISVIVIKRTGESSELAVVVNDTSRTNETTAPQRGIGDGSGTDFPTDFSSFSEDPIFTVFTMAPSEEKIASVPPSKCFASRQELVDAVDIHVSWNFEARRDLAATYGWPIGTWCFNGITDMSSLFSANRNALLLDFNQDISQWDVGAVTNMSELFYQATRFDQNLSSWDTSRVTDMSFMFAGATVFNGDITTWDTTNVNSFHYTFSNAVMFNQDIGDWKIRYVGLMAGMFQEASSFNADISRWSMARVEDVSIMFDGASSFNQPIGSWNLGSWTIYFHTLFRGATSFNQDLSSWDVSGGNAMWEMFRSATLFNQPLNSWQTTNILYFEHMFQDAVAFNQNLLSWETSKAEEFQYMFAGATAFNHGSIENWDTSNCWNMQGMFQGASAFNQNISTWQTANVEYTMDMFADAISFNQPLDSWDVSNVFDMSGMFDGATNFGQDLCSWGDKIGPSLTFADFLFVGTSCPDTADPDLDSMSPFCYPC